MIALAILLADQLIKQWVLLGLDLPLWLIDGQLGIRLVMNESIAFSLPLPPNWSLILSAAVIAGMLLFFFRSCRRCFFADLCFGLIIGGALSNLLDRLLVGAVVDYIQIFWWPVFNLADAAITIGVFCFVLGFERVQGSISQSK